MTVSDVPTRAIHGATQRMPAREPQVDTRDITSRADWLAAEPEYIHGRFEPNELGAEFSFE